MDFLTSASYWYDALAFMVISYQAGFNMIPQIGYQQAIEAWAGDKVSR
jgi:hypothetical protein